MLGKNWNLDNRKINLCMIIAIITMLCSVVYSNVYTVTAEKVHLLGDVDNDNKVTLKDAKQILKYALGIDNIENNKDISDINGDSKVDLTDAKLALQASLGIITITERPIVTYSPENPTITQNPDDKDGANTPNPGQTKTPDSTETPGVTKTPDVTETPLITEETPLPEKRKLAEVEAREENVITGATVSVCSMSGASYDETSDVYTFGKQTVGIGVVNPFAGRYDLHENIVDVISLEAEDGKTLVWDLEGASIDGFNQKPDINQVDKKTYYYIDEAVTYTAPKWNKGISVSFWAKVPQEQRKNPLLVFESGKFSISIWADGSVYFRDGLMKTNMLDNTSDNILGEFGEWNYYTVTIANDWISVYVNGQENLFDTLWLSRKIIGGFNDGFLSRYNFKLDLTQEMVDKDLRGYYLLSGAWNGYTYHDNFSTFANHRFRGCNSGGTTMIDYIIQEDTNMWLGGTTVKVGEKYATYGFESGVSISNVKVYDTELTSEQVAANYKYDTVRPE